MRVRSIAVALLFGMATWPAAGQQTLDHPVGEVLPWGSDSGFRANEAASPAAVYRDAVRVEGARWLRLYFGKVSLADGSFLRLTSLLDGEVQELDAESLALWNGSSAYFNGDAVMVELIAAPQSQNNRVVVENIARAMLAHPIGDPGQCGICGGDDRVQSSEVWTSRLLPAGCTASIYNVDSCMVSAGHCVDGTSNDVVQFNVPNSNGNCSINNPPVADQFPITAKDFVNGGVGNDWAVLIPGTNNLGELPYERYADLRPIAASPSSNGQAVDIWGYGVDTTCVRSQTQQTSGGNITSVAGSWYEFDVDVRGGNSGSALIEGGEIIAVVTHCSFGCPNFGTRVDLAAFANSRANFCTGGGPTEPANNDCANAIGVNEGSFGYSTIGATTDGPGLPGSCDEGFGLSFVNDIWYAYTATCTGDATVSLCNSDYDTRMAVYTDAGCPGALVACNDDACGTGGTRSEVTFPVTGGTTYLVRVGGFNGSGSGTMDITCVGVPTGPPNDLCSNAIDLGNAPVVSDNFDNTEATAGANGAPLLSAGCNQFGDSPGILFDLWWTWTAPASGTASFNTCGGGLDTKMAVYQSACPNTDGTEIGCSDDGDCPAGAGAGGTSASDVTIAVTSGTTYIIRVGAWGTDGGAQGPTGTGIVNVELLTAASGACCLPDGSCSIQTAADCGLLGGSYSGDGTSCDPNLCPQPCPADCAAAGDGSVDILDLLELLAQWGSAGSCDIAPAGGDGTVDILDLLELLGSWGPCS